MHKRVWLFLLVFLLLVVSGLSACTLPPPPMAETLTEFPGNPEATLEQRLIDRYDLSSWYSNGLPLVLPEMEGVTFKDLVFRSTEEEQVEMRLYYPPNIPPDALLPVVIQPNIMPDAAATNVFGAPLDEHPQVRYFGMLFAANGFASVTHGTTQIDDFDVLMSYLYENATELHLDYDTVGLYDCCFASYFSTMYAHQPGHENVKFIVNYFGAFNSPDRHLHDLWIKSTFGYYTQYPDLEAFRTDLPILVLRAGQVTDSLPTGMIDHFVETSLAENLDVTLINYPQGVLGLDALQAKEVRTGQILRQTLTFMHDSIERE